MVKVKRRRPKPEGVGRGNRPALVIERAKEAFIRQLAVCGCVVHACEQARIQPNTAYNHRKKDPQFKQDWDTALMKAADDLEQALYNRGLKHDTTAAIFLLKGMRPDKYRERYSVTAEEKQIDEAIEAEFQQIQEKDLKFLTLEADNNA